MKVHRLVYRNYLHNVPSLQSTQKLVFALDSKEERRSVTYRRPDRQGDNLQPDWSVMPNDSLCQNRDIVKALDTLRLAKCARAKSIYRPDE